MIKKYIFLFFLTLFVLIFIGYKSITIYAINYITKEYHIKIKSISGDIVDNISFNDIRYNDKRVAKRVELKWNIKRLFDNEIEIEELKIDGLIPKNFKKLYDNLAKNQKRSNKKSIKFILNRASLSIKSYQISSLKIENILLRLKNITLKRADIDELQMEIKLKDEKFKIQKTKGYISLKSNKIFEASLDSRLSTRLAKDVPIKVLLSYNKKLHYTVKAHIATLDDIDKRVKKLLKDLDIELIDKHLTFYNKKLNAIVDFDKSFKEAKVELKTKKLYLKNFIEQSPKDLEFKIVANGLVNLSKKNIVAIYKIDSNYADINGTYKSKTNTSLLTLTLPKNSALPLKFPDLKYDKLFPVNGAIRLSKQQVEFFDRFFKITFLYGKDFKADIRSKELQIKLSKTANHSISFNILANSLKQASKELKEIYPKISMLQIDKRVNIDGEYRGEKVNGVVKIGKRYGFRVEAKKVDDAILANISSLKSFSIQKDINCTTLNAKMKYQIKRSILSGDIRTTCDTPFANMTINGVIKAINSKDFNLKANIIKYKLKTENSLIEKYLKDANVSVDMGYKKLNANILNPYFKARYSSTSDYLKGRVSIKSKELSLSEFVNVKGLIKRVAFRAEINSNDLDIKDINSSKIECKIDSNLINLTSIFHLNDKAYNILATLPKNSLLYSIDKKFDPKPLFPVKIVLKRKRLTSMQKSTLRKHLQRNGQNFFEILGTVAKPFEKSALLHRSPLEAKAIFDKNFKNVDINGSFFGIKLDAKKEAESIAFKAHIESLREVKNALLKIYRLPKDEIDGALEIEGEYKNKKLSYKIDAPWFLYRYSFDGYFFAKEGSLDGYMKNGTIKIKEYRFKPYLLELYRDLFSSKTTYIWLDKREFLTHLNDKIELKGEFLKGVKLYLKTKSYHLKEPEADVVADADMRYIKKDKKASLDGKIVLDKGVVKYKPKKSYVVSDRDIIIVNEKKEQKSDTSLDMLVNILSKDKLRYIDGKNRVDFKEDLTIYKKGADKSKLFGYVHILGGVYYSSGKKFELKKGELLFDGDRLNPFLNLRAVYKKEPYTITIYIGGRLGSPVINFSSVPYLSKSDILSVMLFNTKVSSSTNFSSAQALQLFGNTFAKGIVNSLGLKFDNVQILSTKNGTFGFSLEKQLSKKLSIIYKNDVTQSIKLRYKNTNHIESDFSFSPESNGVEIYYKK